MARNSRYFAGRKAKQSGDQFENIIEINARIKGLNLIKIWMGCERFGKGDNEILKKRKNPFDYIIQKPNDVPVFFDAKTRSGKTITYSDFYSSKSTKHQVETMSGMADFGALTGFMVWFRELDRIYFIPIEKVENMKSRTSLGPDDGVDLGTLDDLKLDFIWDAFEC